MITKMIALDWLSMKYNWAGVIVIPILCIFMGMFSPTFIIPLSVFWFLGFSTTPFSAEEKGELNYLYLTMPIRRVDVVRGRFALSILLMIVGLVIGISLLSMVSFAALNFDIPFLSSVTLSTEQYMALIAVSYFIYAFFNLFMFPFLFKLGYEKGKYLGTYLPIAVLFLALLTHDIIMWQFEVHTSIINILINYVAENLLLAVGGIVIISTKLLFLSYVVSVRAYNRRDF